MAEWQIHDWIICSKVYESIFGWLRVRPWHFLLVAPSGLESMLWTGYCGWLVAESLYYFSNTINWNPMDCRPGFSSSVPTNCDPSHSSPKLFILFPRLIYFSDEIFEIEINIILTSTHSLGIYLQHWTWRCSICVCFLIVNFEITWRSRPMILLYETSNSNKYCKLSAHSSISQGLHHQ